MIATDIFRKVASNILFTLILFNRKYIMHHTLEHTGVMHFSDHRMLKTLAMLDQKRLFIITRT